MGNIRVGWWLCGLLASGAVGCATDPIGSADDPGRDAEPDSLAQTVEAAATPGQQATEPRYVTLGRVEGYGNPITGELYIRSIEVEPKSEPEPAGQAPAGVGVSGSALLSTSAGHCEVTVESDGTPNSNPPGTFEFYNQHDATQATADEPSFAVSTCLGRLQPAQQTGGSGVLHSTLFSTQGVGCALQHIGNFTTRTYAHVFLDVDVFNGQLSKHGPYGPPYTTGTVTTPPGRNTPYQDLGLWDFGSLAPGQTKEMWVYFMNGDSNDFTFSGFLVGEVFEDCGAGGTGNAADEDCDGVNDNGCANVANGGTCYTNADCIDGNCAGAMLVSGIGNGGGDLADDVPGSCAFPSTCGDGLIEGSEECDDMNTLPWDGCSATCMEEADCAPPLFIEEMGTYTGSTVGAGNDHDGSCTGGTGADVIYEYVSHHAGKLCIDTLGSGFNTQLHVMGSCGDPNSEVACDDDSAGGGAAQLQLDVVPGETLHIVVDGFDPDSSGNYELRLQPQSCCPAGHLDVNGTGLGCVPVVQGAIGTDHGCALSQQGRLYCWGANYQGHLGDGTNFQRPTAVEVAGGHTNWSFVDAGAYGTCGIRGGRAYCWGYNGNGQLGTGNTNGSLVPVEVTGAHTNWTRVDIGGIHTCGIRGGHLYCWGEGSAGQLGDGLTQPSLVPVEVSGGFADWVKVSVGDNGASCGVRGNGLAYCWGWGGNGQTGIGVQGLVTPVPTLVVGGFTDWQNVEIEGYHACGLRGGRAYCWGNGALGNGAIYESHTPIEVAGGISDFVEVAAGDGNCAIRNGGQLYCWGSNTGGGISAYYDLPTDVSGGRSWSGLVSYGGACAIAGGGLFCWGGGPNANPSGVDTSGLVPTEIAGGHTDWSAAALGYAHTCGLRGGHAYCWGDNGNGQCGNYLGGGPVAGEVNGNFSDYTSLAANREKTLAVRGGHLYEWGGGFWSFGPDAAEVDPGITDWQSVATGYAVDCALRQNGRLYCWGDNYNGEVGNGSINPVYSPVEVDGNHTGWTALHLGYHHSCGLRAGRAYCWGSNGYVALGDGSGLDQLTPAQVAGSHADWTAIGGGFAHTCGIRAGRAYCWGEDYYSQLGNGGGTASAATPSEVAGGFTDWTAITSFALARTTCGIRAGRIYCWGRNEYGQLGDGTGLYTDVPVEIMGAYSDWQDVSMGEYHVCGRRQGRMYCWGNPYSGQLGVTLQGTPVALQGP